jgi:hypothetical protein
LTLLALVTAAAALAAANVWFTAVRSTIPLALDAVVASKETRHEKHPPKDDVCLIRLDDQRQLQVDQPIYGAIRASDHLRKQPWSRRLDTSGRVATLYWSRDSCGMAYAMSISLAIIAASAACVALWHDSTRQ